MRLVDDDGGRRWQEVDVAGQPLGQGEHVKVRDHDVDAVGGLAGELRAAPAPAAARTLRMARAAQPQTIAPSPVAVRAQLEALGLIDVVAQHRVQPGRPLSGRALRELLGAVVELRRVAVGCVGAQVVRAAQQPSERRAGDGGEAASVAHVLVAQQVRDGGDDARRARPPDVGRGGQRHVALADPGRRLHDHRALFGDGLRHELDGGVLALAALQPQAFYQPFEGRAGVG